MSRFKQNHDVKYIIFRSLIQMLGPSFFYLEGSRDGVVGVRCGFLIKME